MAWNASARPADIPSLMSQMQKNYATMNQLYQRLGDSSRQERQQLTKLRQDTKDLAAQIKSAISADQSPKMTHDKYVSDFGRMLKDFTQLSTDISKREAAMLEEMDRDANRYSSVPAESLPANRRQTMKDYNASNWQDAETAMIQETNAELRAIERDLTDLNDMVRTVHQEVGVQGESINRVEQNTTTAERNVEGGTKELGTAAKLANAIRKKKLIIILLCICICIVLALAIGLPLYFTLR